MAARLTLPRTAAWVWHAEPRSIFGLEAVFVRCTSGTSAAGHGGFGFADNYRAWAAARGPAVIPWAWIGPPASSDGVACAEALHAIAPGQRIYVVEVGAGIPGEQVAAFAARLRQHEPIAALGFSTWPTRAEAEAAGVPWDACVDAFDFGLPQVFASYQRELLLRPDSPVVADMLGKPIHVAVFPDADPGWIDSARLAVTEHAGVSAWAVDQSSFASWRRQLGALGEGRLGLPSPPAEPMARPAEREAPEAPAGPAVPAGVHETLTPVHFDEPGEQTLLANRILAVVQARLDAGDKLTDDQLVADIEAVLQDSIPLQPRAIDTARALQELALQPRAIDTARALPEPTLQPRAIDTAHARLDCPDIIVAGHEFGLQVGISPVLTEGTITDGPMEVPVVDYDLAVQVHADGFSLRDGGSWRREARVTEANRYPVFDLHLVADPQEEPVRPRSIRALYSANGQTIGMAIRPVAVVRAPDQAAPAGAGEPHEPTVLGTLPVTEDAPDLTVRILLDDANPRRLNWYLESPHLRLSDEPIVVQIGDDAKAFLRRVVDRLSAYLSQPGIELELKGIGRQLADLIDARLWEALRAIAAQVARPPRILLLSEEPYVPWELAVVDPPLDPEAPPFLGAQASVGRWVLGSRRPKLPPPTGQEVRRMAVVSGVFGNRPGLRRLPEAEEEARVLREQYGATAVEANLPALLRFIQGDPVVDLAHFAVHGKYDQSGVQDGLLLVDGKVLNPDQVRGIDLAGTPFVFLNACQVGASNQVLGEYAGLAAAFLYAGASAVVAPLWSVDDSMARELALSFYRRLAERRESRPAEAFREARARFAQAVEEGSVTYLAYQFFGHPSMKLVREGGP